MLRIVPTWQPHIANLGQLCQELFHEIAHESQGRVLCHGQGLMWGVLFAHNDPSVRAQATGALKKACAVEGVLPYFVPAGGCMVTPLYDCTRSELQDAIGVRLRRAVVSTCTSMGWEPTPLTLSDDHKQVSTVP